MSPAKGDRTKRSTLEERSHSLTLNSLSCITLYKPGDFKDNQIRTIKPKTLRVEKSGFLKKPDFWAQGLFTPTCLGIIGCVLSQIGIETGKY
ncbi:hypothetical protein H6F96_23745 [Microcoleus sp. FACHB-53]|nr:hypothetical protein [Microcoleus sp. FACHB-53]MBD2126306.1 hypothetical protein [Microcoleus sp. FACHB-1]